MQVFVRIVWIILRLFVLGIVYCVSWIIGFIGTAVLYCLNAIVGFLDRLLSGSKSE